MMFKRASVEFGSGEDFQARRMQRESKGLQTSGVSTTSILALLTMKISHVCGI
jgi:hypothetical protein